MRYSEKRSQLQRQRRLRSAFRRQRRALLERLLHERGDQCEICLRPCPPDDRSIDHRIELSRGGTNDLSNLQLTHHRCNTQREADRLHMEYLLRRQPTLPATEGASAL